MERVVQHGGIFYRLIFVHRYTSRQFTQTSLSRIEPTKEEVMALWDMLQRYMDVSQPLPDVPRLEPFRHLDPVTAEHDQKTGRNPRFWRNLDLQAWKQGEGAEWLKRQAEYPWNKRRCRPDPEDRQNRHGGLQGGPSASGFHSRFVNGVLSLVPMPASNCGNTMSSHSTGNGC